MGHLDFRATDIFGRKTQREPGDIFEQGELVVEEPWETKYVDVAANLDPLDKGTWGRQLQSLRLPCGQQHKEAKADAELTVAQACGLPQPQLVTVVPEPSPGSLSLICFAALSGSRLGEVIVDDAESTILRDVWKDLVQACGLSPAAVRFITSGGIQLSLAHRSQSVAAIFGSGAGDLAAAPVQQLQTDDVDSS